MRSRRCDRGGFKGWASRVSPAVKRRGGVPRDVADGIPVTGNASLFEFLEDLDETLKMGEFLRRSGARARFEVLLWFYIGRLALIRDLFQCADRVRSSGHL